jgi:hypothetical protein
MAASFFEGPNITRPLGVFCSELCTVYQTLSSCSWLSQHLPTPLLQLLGVVPWAPNAVSPWSITTCGYLFCLADDDGTPPHSL